MNKFVPIELEKLEQNVNFLTAETYNFLQVNLNITCRHCHLPPGHTFQLPQSFLSSGGIFLLLVGSQRSEKKKD